jgi:hypothetical protein
LVKKIKRIFAKKEPTEDIIPQVLMEVETSLIAEANQILNNFMEDMGTSNSAEAIEVKCSEEALKVMKEVNLASENVLREKFPSVPETNPQKLREMESHGI